MKLLLFWIATGTIMTPLALVAQQRKTDSLSPVTVTAKTPAIERKADKIIVHPDALLTSAGNNVLELMERLPGIRVNNDQLTMKGKNHVTIFIDGKPSYLQGDDLTNYLRSLPAGIIEKIEIMANPPARYDAAGMGGIINIQLKKGKATGFHGNLLSENIRGRHTRLFQTANANFRYQQFNVYGNLTYYKGRGFSSTDTKRWYGEAGDPVSSLTQQTHTINPNYRWMGKLGIDWQSSSRTTWSIALDRLYRNVEEKTILDSRQTYAGLSRDTLTNGHNQSGGTLKNNGLHLGFRQQFDSSEHALSAEADDIRYSHHYGFANASALNATDDTENRQEHFEGRLPVAIHIRSIKADYVHPFNKRTKIESGLKSASTRVNSTSNFSLLINDTVSPAFDQANQFHYKENIHAAYLNVSTSWNQLSLQAGARLEHTDIEGTQLNNYTGKDSSFSRHYTQLFPSFFLLFKLDNKGYHQLSFSYSRRIDRPDYNSLHPFATPLDRYTFRQGNPLLQPQFSGNMELSYTFRNFGTVTFFYNHLKGATEEMIVPKGQLMYRQPGNTGRKTISGLLIDGSLPITKWWTFSHSFLFTNWHTRTLIYINSVDIKSNNWSLSSTHQFRFPKGWSAEINTDYSSHSVFTQYKQGSSWYIHAGIGKKLLNDKAAIKINVRDIFYSRIDRQELQNVNDLTGVSSRSWDTRSVTVLLSWKFSKGSKNNTATRKPGANLESRRLGEQ